VSIIQPDQRQDQLPSQFVESSETPVDASPPTQSRSSTTGGGMPVILWSLLLLFGILMLLARGPLNAPALEDLTSYACDPIPLPRGSWNRRMPLILYTCRAGDTVVYARSGVTDGSNPILWKTCIRSGGLIRIWRHARPSPYGPYIFRSTCNNQIVMSYKNRAANYESSQRFGIAVASAVIFLSFTILTLKIVRRLRRVS
jgi:hypothetical protein